MTYTEQLQQPKWYQKRELIKLRDLNKCTKCDSYIKLVVHHTYYESGKLVWEYPDDSLITLCNECHIEIHKTTKIKKIRKLYIKTPKLIITDEMIMSCLQLYKTEVEKFKALNPNTKSFNKYEVNFTYLTKENNTDWYYNTIFPIVSSCKYKMLKQLNTLIRDLE
jgi:hypothetical protein